MERAELNKQIKELTAIINQQKIELIRLGESAQVLNTVLDIVAGIHWWKDKHGIYRGCNEAMVTQLGLKSKNDILGKSDYELPWSAQAEMLIDNDNEVMRTGQIQKGKEELVATKEGVIYTFIVAKAPIYDDSGQIIGTVGNSIDITEQKKQEQALRAATEKAEQANHAKTEFIANMSHDIRTPLAGIIGVATLLAEEAKIEKEQRSALMIHQSGTQLLNLLNGVLDVVSADNMNEEDIHSETFDLRASIEGLHELLLPSVESKGLELLIDIDPMIPSYVINDRIKIERILLNIITNAIKFTHHGHVELHIRLLRKKNNSLHLEFTITDTGVGIAKDQLHKVFDRFFRATPAYEGVYSGNGVGLYIVKKFVSLLGGKVHIESQLDEGTTFCFALLMKMGKASEVKAINSNEVATAISSVQPPILKDNLIRTFSHAHSDNTDGKPRLLLVEDEPIACHVAQNFLETAGFSVTIAEDGETAMKFAKKGNFELIVSDIGLPGMSGNEWTAAFRHWEWTSHKSSVPIVGLTAHATGKAKEDCLAAGMNDVLSKPINLNIATNLFRQFCEIAEEKLKISGTTEEKIGALGRDLPETEAKLFELENYHLFDEDDGLEKLGGNKELLVKMIKMLTQQDLLNEVTLLKKAHKQPDWEIIQEIAHKLKGGALYCGTQKMRYACQYMERYCLAGHTKLLEELFEQLMKVLEETRQYLIVWLSKK